MQTVKRNLLRLFFGINLSACVTNGYAQSPQPQEYELKALFLFNFTRFVEWPNDVFTSNEEPFVIGVLGDDPFGDYLDKVIRNEKVGTHPITIERFKELPQVKSCHILFINFARHDKPLTVISDPRLTKVLTVSDASDFAASGGMIGFKKESKKIGIQINLEVVHRANLTVSAKLLRVAEIVSTQKRSQ